MKHFKTLFITAIAFSFIVTSCKKDDEIRAPEFVSFELGYDNSGTVVAGEDLHIDAEILAEGKIANVIVTIHPEGEHDFKSVRTIEWEVDSTYTTGYSGVKDIDFHEHIDVPAEAETGPYHFHIKVTDMEGNRTEKEAELEITAPDLK